MLGLSKFLSNLRRLISGSSAETVAAAPEASPAPAPLPADPEPTKAPEPPPNFDWMLPASEAKKFELVGKQDGDVIDSYLFFELGPIDSLTDEEIGAIIGRCFASGAQMGFGDIELHRMAGPAGKTVSLRLRNRQLLLRASLQIRGRYCPLFQVGHVDPLFGVSKGAINFHSYWNTGKPVHPSPFEAAASA